MQIRIFKKVQKISKISFDSIKSKWMRITLKMRMKSDPVMAGREFFVCWTRCAAARSGSRGWRVIGCCDMNFLATTWHWIDKTRFSYIAPCRVRTQQPPPAIYQLRTRLFCCCGGGCRPFWTLSQSLLIWAVRMLIHFAIICLQSDEMSLIFISFQPNVCSFNCIFGIIFFIYLNLNTSSR